MSHGRSTLERTGGTMRDRDRAQCQTPSVTDRPIQLHTVINLAEPLPQVTVDGKPLPVDAPRVTVVGEPANSPRVLACLHRPMSRPNKRSHRHVQTRPRDALARSNRTRQAALRRRVISSDCGSPPWRGAECGVVGLLSTGGFGGATSPCRSTDARAGLRYHRRLSCLKLPRDFGVHLLAPSHAADGGLRLRGADAR